VDGPGHDALLALVFAAQAVCAHCVSLPTASLPVRENADIVTVEEAGDEVLHFIVDLLLCAGLREHAIEEK